MIALLLSHWGGGEAFGDGPPGVLVWVSWLCGFFFVGVTVVDGWMDGGWQDLPGFHQILSLGFVSEIDISRGCVFAHVQEAPGIYSLLHPAPIGIASTPRKKEMGSCISRALDL